MASRLPHSSPHGTRAATKAHHRVKQGAGKKESRTGGKERRDLLYRDPNRQIGRSPQDVNGRKREIDAQVDLALLLRGAALNNRCSCHDWLYCKRSSLLTPKTIFESYTESL